MNPYDWCVANKLVQGSQLTITWHVDDLKISHVNKEILDDLLKQLDGAFGQERPLTIHHGKKHNYLGMWLSNFSGGQKAKKKDAHNKEFPNMWMGSPWKWNA